MTYIEAVEKGRQGGATKEQIDTMNNSKVTDVNEIRRMHTQHMADTRNKSNNNNNSKERHTRNSNASSNTRGNNNEARQTHTQYRQSDTHNRSQI